MENFSQSFEKIRLSLLQAEALHSLIHAKSIQGVQFNKGLDGDIDDVCSTFKSRTLDFVLNSRARLDYPGDDLGYMSDVILKQDMGNLAKEAERIADTGELGGRRYTEQSSSWWVL